MLLRTQKDLNQLENQSEALEEYNENRRKYLNQEIARLTQQLTTYSEYAGMTEAEVFEAWNQAFEAAEKASKTVVGADEALGDAGSAMDKKHHSFILHWYLDKQAMDRPYMYEYDPYIEIILDLMFKFNIYYNSSNYVISYEEIETKSHDLHYQIYKP